MNEKLRNLLQQLLELLGLIKKEIPMETPSQKLYRKAKEFVGVDASPRDVAPDELGCAESVSEVVKAARGQYINNTLFISTVKMYEALVISPGFRKVSIPTPGCIIISPTANSMRIGHVGIVSENGKIMSNDSVRKVWLENFSLDSWKKYYAVKLQLPVYYFEPL